MSTSPESRPEAIEPASAIRLGLGAALLASLAAGLCCAAPLLYLAFGVSAAALSGLSSLGWLQAPMAVVAVLCLGAAFFRLYVSKRPVCAQADTRKRLRIYFWATALLALVLLSYPFVVPWLLA